LLVPDLLGEGNLGSPAELTSEREALEALQQHAKAEGIAVDFEEARAELLRAEFERALRLSSPDRAAEIAARFSGRPDGMLLEARLSLARGERPPQGPLKVLTQATDPRVAEAARVLLARLIAPERPAQALELLREKVRPHVVERERDRANLFSTAEKLDVQAVGSLLERVDDTELKRRAALNVIDAGRRLAAQRPVELERLSAALRILVLLGARTARDGEASVVFARAVVSAAREVGDGGARVLLLEHLAESGLRCGEFEQGGLLVDASPLEPEAIRLRTLVALVRLEVRIQRAHLEGLSPEALDALPKDAASLYLRHRIALACGDSKAAAALHRLVGDALGKELGPVHRARALAIGSEAAGDAEATLVERALALDPGSPWVRICHARVLAKQGQGPKALDEAEGAHVLFDRKNRARHGEEAERLRFWRALTLVHAQRRDEALTEVFLKKLEKAGDAQQPEVADEARALLAE
jgi:hypothetical protein